VNTLILLLPSISQNLSIHFHSFSLKELKPICLGTKNDWQLLFLGDGKQSKNIFGFNFN